MGQATRGPLHKNINVKVNGVGDLNINYIEDGSQNSPNLVLLHGFPSDSRQYRDFASLLSHKYHVFAPDMPGFGLTSRPEGMKYTFDYLTAAVEAWLDALKITSFAIYIFDYGAPVGLRLALRYPERIKAIISQNGNAYDEGFGPENWAPIFKLWETHDSLEVRELIREKGLTLEQIKAQYTVGVPEADQSLVNPVQWHVDYLFNVAGKDNQEHQLDLFYDYRKNKEMYPQFQEYFRKSQVPLLAVWGKGDQWFIPPGAEAFKRDLPDAEIHFVGAGHFALEAARWEIAKLTLEFLKKIGY